MNHNSSDIEMDPPSVQPGGTYFNAEKENQFANQICNNLDQAVKYLTDITTILEDWDYYTDNSNVKDIKGLMKSYHELVLDMKDSVFSPDAHLPQLPLGLIDHVDEGKSPNTWLKMLFDDVGIDNDIVRGEVKSILVFKQAMDKLWKERDQGEKKSGETN